MEVATIGREADGPRFEQFEQVQRGPDGEI
jgi:hypothetical protein